MAQINHARKVVRRVQRRVRTIRTHLYRTSSRPCFIGVTRFSVFQPDQAAWKLTREGTSLDTYRERLYATDRMRLRCDIFLGLSVPILQRMAEEHDYRHIVHYSDSMPDPWRSELLEAAQRYPVLLLHPNESGQPVQKRLTELVRQSSKVERTVVQFRLDDDDLLAVSYLDQLSQYTSPTDRGRAVSLARGFTARFSQSTLGPVHLAHRVFGAQGLAFVSHYDPIVDEVKFRSNVSHTNVSRRMPTIVDSRKHAFFQMRHVGQDVLTDVESQTRAIEEQLSKLTQQTDLSPVRAAFPTLAPLLTAQDNFREVSLCRSCDGEAIHTGTGAETCVKQLTSLCSARHCRTAPGACLVAAVPRI